MVVLDVDRHRSGRPGRSCGHGRKQPTHGRESAGIIRSGCAQNRPASQDNPGSTAPTAAPGHPPWHVLSECAEAASLHQRPDSHTDMAVAHLPTSPAPFVHRWLSLWKLLDTGWTQRATHILCAAQGTGGAELGVLRPLAAVQSGLCAFSYVPCGRPALRRGAPRPFRSRDPGVPRNGSWDFDVQTAHVRKRK